MFTLMSLLKLVRLNKMDKDSCDEIFFLALLSDKICMINQATDAKHKFPDYCIENISLIWVLY